MGKANLIFALLLSRCEFGSAAIKERAFCCRAREAPLDPLILQNQALVRRFQEAAQEPVLDDLTGTQ